MMYVMLLLSEVLRPLPWCRHDLHRSAGDPPRPDPVFRHEAFAPFVVSGREVSSFWVVVGVDILFVVVVDCNVALVRSSQAAGIGHA